MPTMERIPISEWGQQPAKSSHTTPSATASALDNTKNDDYGNIAPTVSECRSDIDYYPAPAQQQADDTQRRPDDTTSYSAAACPVANTPRSTTIG